VNTKKQEQFLPKKKMSITKNLLDAYNCCICLEPMKTAVSFNPCGHEVNEKCAKDTLSSTKKCPMCRVDVESFRPAYFTRQAVESLLKTMQQPKITIHVKTLLGHKYTFKVEKDSKVINLFNLIFAETEIHPSQIKLLFNNKLISPFSNLNEYFLSDDVEFNTLMSIRFDHWTTIAKEFPLIFQKAVSELKNGENLREKFMSIYRESIKEAMNS
jgi:hypothetical protein